MTYRKRLFLLVLIDSFIIISAFFLSKTLLFYDNEISTKIIITSSIAFLLTYHFFSHNYKLYKKAWEYASIGELIIIIKTISLSIISSGVAQQIIFQDVFVRLLIVTGMLHILMIGGSRFSWRIIRNQFSQKTTDKKLTLIVGAGSAGTMVARQLLLNQDTELTPVAFIDDDVKKHRLDILGIPVVGGRGEIEKAVEKHQIEHIIIAIPSLKSKELNKIFHECLKTRKKTQIIPMLEDLMTGRISVSHFRDIQVEDLLGREPVELDVNRISEYIKNKVILITGAGGSIGSEICRQLAVYEPKKLILLGHGENSIYSIKMELDELFGKAGFELCAEIADIQDAQKIMTVMNKYQPNIVYHAAAHKHVPLMENNPEEAVKNNVIGTMNVAHAASWNGVEDFVMISTDKAVNPTSVMGATKRLAEIIIQNMNKESKTKFAAVRFGNVLGSRGSVIPLFKKQIEKGGPVTVTHPDMVRYFMTIPEASRLVLQAGALAKGGEIFVLDMGEPVKIVDLAKNLIQLSGNSVDEIGIEYTGIRQGEKLYEELLKEDEVHEEQIYPKIYIGKSTHRNLDSILGLLDEFSSLEKDVLRERVLFLSNQETVEDTTKLAAL